MTLKIELPVGIELNEFELLMNLAAKLFERGLLTSGQAAKMVGISKKAFLEIVGRYGVSIFQYDIDEIEEDISNA